MKRNTIQRALILKAIRTLQCHPTAEEVYEAVVGEHPTISRSTVYRNLKQLAENKEIRNMEVPGESDHFDHICHDHYHVRCLLCGGVFDVDMEYIRDLEKEIKNANGFNISGHDLIFKGTCPNCIKSTQKNAHQGAKNRKSYSKETRP